MGVSLSSLSLIIFSPAKNASFSVSKIMLSIELQPPEYPQVLQFMLIPSDQPLKNCAVVI